MKTLIKSHLLRIGYTLEKVTPDDDVRSLLDMIRPKQGDTELIRIGGANDGGYLIPNDLKDIEACFSPGVDTSSGFESDLANHGIRSYMADYSVDGPASANSLFDFEKKYLGLYNDATTTRLDDWVKRKPLKSNSDLVLQMDIEGHEFPVLLDASRATLRRYRIMAIEFHGMGRVFNKASFELFNQLFLKLTDDFTVVHAHPNNCCSLTTRGDFQIPNVIELTLLRTDRFKPTKNPIAYPHPLDEPCVPLKEEITLPKCWLESFHN